MLDKGSVVAVWIDQETTVIGEFLGVVEFAGTTYISLSYPAEFKSKVVPVPSRLEVPGQTAEGAVQLVKVSRVGTTVPMVPVMNIPVGKYPFGVIPEESPDYTMYHQAQKVMRGDDGVPEKEG